MGIFKAYDIRGIYGQDLTDDIFYKIARAYAKFAGVRKVVVARDCRTHSEPLFAAFANGLTDVGVDVIDVGRASTPMSYFANASLKADGSVMITAAMICWKRLETSRPTNSRRKAFGQKYHFVGLPMPSMFQPDSAARMPPR